MVNETGKSNWAIVDLTTWENIRRSLTLVGAGVLTVMGVGPATTTHGDEPKQGAVHRAELGGGASLEVVFIPPGEFMMGSTPEEKRWATGIEFPRRFPHLPRTTARYHSMTRDADEQAELNTHRPRQSARLAVLAIAD